MLLNSLWTRETPWCSFFGKSSNLSARLSISMTVVTSPERIAKAGYLRVRWTAIAYLLSVAAYAPAFRNGFISDDFVILGRIENWTRDLSTFAIPPEGPRLVLYGCFALLRGLFGYRPEAFYAFALMLHLLNVWLLGKLLFLLTSRKSVSAAGSILFAVFQNPQEAVMWLAAMSDALAGVFVLVALIAWAKERHAWSAVWYMGALFSKESGIALLVLIPLIDWLRTGRVRFRLAYLYLLLPSAVFLAVFLANLHSNAFFSVGLYAFRPFGALVLVNSAHRLAFPWIYIALLLYIIGGARIWSREVAAFCAWIPVTLAPYCFITYQSHVPSRSQYLAAMGVAALIALLMDNLRERTHRVAFLSAFILVNIGYLWVVKYPQYVIRRMPTELLLNELRSRSPRCLEISGFPLNPWIAKETTLLVPGWHPEMLRVDVPSSGPCERLRWNGVLGRYEPLNPGK